MQKINPKRGFTGLPRLLWLLRALYHPNNEHLLHLNSCATLQERAEFSASVGSVAVFAATENVNAVGNVDAVNLHDSTPIASLLLLDINNNN